MFFPKRDAEIGHLPGGFKCEFGGGTQGAEEERGHAETQISRVERRKLCYLAFFAAIPTEQPFAEKSSKIASGSGRRKLHRSLGPQGPKVQESVSSQGQRER